MSKKSCGHKGRIERLYRTGNIYCHKQKRNVTIVIDSDGRRCTDNDCPYSSKALAEKS